MVRSFECGYQEFGGLKQSLCPSDPEFPKLSDYELVFHPTTMAGGEPWWTCSAIPRTELARSVHLRSAIGGTKEAAGNEMAHNYEQRAKPWMRIMGDS